MRVGRQSLCGDAEVTGLTVQLAHLLLRNRIRGRDGGDEQPLAEADLSGLEKRRKPALDQVGDGLELADRTGPVDIGQNPNELVSAARGLHLIELCGEVG